ncbi:hypothetical protein AGMMS50239_05140 [Bacteroidia bacterium]|nr:hypothetical protein AGMMS50239_05140 [Bacteroidia bacterium]
MNLIRYIQGIRKGTEINRLERKAMEDPFLAEAMEGYDKIREEHEVRVKRMQNKVSAQTRSSNSALHHWSIAATILLIIGIAGGGYFLWNQFSEPETLLVAESISKPLDTMALENLEEQATTDSLSAEYEPQDYSYAYDKQIETTMIQAEKPANEQEIKALQVLNLKEDSPVNVDLAEKKILIVDTISIPQPVTGFKAYNEYLKAHLIRPTDEECKNATGVVTLTFSIDKNGRPYNIHIAKSLCPLADWEAMRLVKEGSDWTTGESIATVNVYF